MGSSDRARAGQSLPGRRHRAYRLDLVFWQSIADSPDALEALTASSPEPVRRPRPPAAKSENCNNADPRAEPQNTGPTWDLPL